MLESVKISRRQSEIRSALSALVGKENPTEDETRQMTALDGEYRTNETRYRAALIAEDTERREAKDDLETRGDREYSDLVRKFELRQVALHYAEGRSLDGATNEIVSEMRSRGSYRGVPVPLAALELRAGETVASGTPDPIVTRPIIDRLFPASVAGRMGGQLIDIPSGAVEWPLTTSSITAGWASTELGNVAGPTTYATADRALKPEQNLGIQVRVSRKALLQSGDALEAAIRRDLNGTIAAELDKAIFQGSGASGQPLGVIYGQSTYAYGATSPTTTDLSWSVMRTEIAAFMAANAATTPGDVRILLHPQAYSFLDDTLISGTAVSEWDRLVKNVPLSNIAISSNTTVVTAGTPDTTDVLLTTNAGGVAPFVTGVWGGVDIVRDPFSDAQSGGLRLTALLTADVNILRAGQLHLVKAIQVE
jgi:HK97 family phage major capsid protein